MFSLWLWLLRILLLAGATVLWFWSEGKLPAWLPLPGPLFAIVGGAVLAAAWLVTELLGRHPPPKDVEKQLEAAYEGRRYIPQLEVQLPPGAPKPEAPKREPFPDRSEFIKKVNEMAAAGKFAALAAELPKQAVLDPLLGATEPQERQKLLVSIAKAMEAGGDLDGAALRAKQARDLKKDSGPAREILCRAMLAKGPQARLDDAYPLFKELASDWRETHAELVLGALRLGLSRPAISARLIDQIWGLLESYRRNDDVAEPFADEVLRHVKDRPERADLLCLVARLRAAMGREKEGLALAARVLDTTPDCPATLRLLLERHSAAGTLSELSRELMRRKAEGKTSAAIDATIAQIDASLKAQVAAATKPLPPLDQGMGHFAAGAHAQAIPCLQEALRTAGVDQIPFVRYLLARAFLGHKQPEPALEHVDRIDPGDLLLEQRFDLAADLERGGHYQHAVKLYASVAASDSGYRDVQLCLERIERAAERDPQQRFEQGIAASLPARYKNPRMVGQGGMGVVYRAHDQESGLAVAIKLLNPMVASDGEHRRRFLREARTLADLSHPGVVRILEVGEKPLPFYAMEYLEGRTLAERLDKEGKLAAEEAAPLAARVAEALGYCHDKGLVHRDVKPHNVFLETGGRTVLIDFGLVHDQGKTALTRTGAMMGTPSYMAPEQISGDPVTPATDVYALGVTIFEMTTGRLPFEGDDLIGQILNKEAPAPRQLGVVLPGVLERAILRCLEKEPQKRFQSGSELAKALE